jgi:hypothetical protein
MCRDPDVLARGSRGRDVAAHFYRIRLEANSSFDQHVVA